MSSHPGPTAELATLAGRYVLGAAIGRGGAAQVYEAHDRVLGELVAVKILNTECARNPELVARFARETAATASIESPHVVRVLDAGHDPARGFYLAMERLHGLDFRQYRLRFGALHPMWAVALAYQTALGLVAAHDAGIAHRDLKPSNVFLSMGPGGALHVRLVDFGIAKLLGATAPGEGDLTRPGTALGTPQYMAPEQLRAPLEVDHRADVYALGALFVEALTGEPLVRYRRNYAEMLVDVLEPKEPRVAARVEGAPDGLDELLAAMVAQDPAARPQTMREVAGRIAELAAAWRSAPAAALAA